MLNEQPIDMLRAVPECAVRLWCGAEVRREPDAVLVQYEDRITKFTPAVYEQALEVVRILRIRPRSLRFVQDVLTLRHDAEDVYTDVLFGKQNTPKVLFVPSGVTASAYYRAMIPATLMFESNRVVAHYTMSVDLAKVLRFDVLWIQLLTNPILTEIARQAKAAGLKVVYDIDDRLDAVPFESEAAFSVYMRPDKQKEIRDMVETADLVTVSTEPLIPHVKQMGAKAVLVLPNQLTANVIPRRQPPDPRFVRILWAGSPTHKLDLAIVAPALRAVLRRHAGRVRFTLFGERVPDDLRDCREWIDVKEPVDFDGYHDALAAIGADFGIVPLVENQFNETKSAIKGIEYMTAGYPVLCSPQAEYPAIVAAGAPVQIVQDDAWEAALERMIALTPAERDDLGRAGTKWVLANRCMGSNHAAAWSEVVEDLLKEKRADPVPEEQNAAR